jgi:hypothetical protein
MEIKGGCDIDEIPAPPPTAVDEGLISSNPPWGWQEAMVALGGILCIIAAVALPWAKVTATWRSILWGSDIELGTYTFKLLENPWLAAAVITVAVVCIAGLFLRRHAGKVSVVASAILLVCSTVYLISLIQDALDWLGIYENLLELVRSIPTIGPLVESVIRDRLDISALPHAGLFLFYAGALVILVGGIIIWKRNNRWANQVI